MSSTVLVTSANPVTFLLEVAKEIKRGYYAYETFECIPHIDLVCEVLLIKGEKPAQRNDFSAVDQVYVQAHNEIALIQEVQDCILQGFEIDPTKVSVGGLVGWDSVLLVRPAKEESKPKATDPALKAPQADPAADVVDAPSDTPAEPEKAPAKRGGRPPKSKEA